MTIKKDDKNGNDLFEGRTIFSGAEAAQYAQTSWGTFKNHVFVRDAIPNAGKIGGRRCFTRQQLDDYREYRYSSLPFWNEKLTIAQACEHLGMGRSRFTYYIHHESYGQHLPFERVGGSGQSNRNNTKRGGIILFEKYDLDAFRDAVLVGGAS